MKWTPSYPQFKSGQPHFLFFDRFINRVINYFFMDYITIIGLTAATLTTSAFFPQAYRIWKLKEARDISLNTFVVLSLGVFLWLVYGILKSDIAIILANAVTLVLALIILYFKFKYKHRNSTDL